MYLAELGLFCNERGPVMGLLMTFYFSPSRRLRVDKARRQRPLRKLKVKKVAKRSSGGREVIKDMRTLIKGIKIGFLFLLV